MTMSPLRFLKAQPRFFTSALAGALIWLFLPHDWRSSTRLLVAWDCATALYLILATVMADPLVHPCPGDAEQCARVCAGQPIGRLPWRCTRASCQCPKPIPWPRGFRTH